MHKTKKILISILSLQIVVIVALLVAIVVVTVRHNTASYHFVSTGKTDYAAADFDYKFIKLENKAENMLYSPLSINYALNMLRDGSEGDTKTQIDNLIAGTELTKYQNIDKVLSLANALYIRDTYASQVKGDYEQKLKSDYDAEIIYDNFQSADNVNQWISDKTFAQIQNLLTDNNVTSSDLILINALAIDMNWDDTFTSSASGDTFYRADGSEMEATTMQHNEIKSDSISYYLDDGMTALAMDLKPYDDTQLQFLALMPSGDLSSFVDGFSTEDVQNITDALIPSTQTKDGVDVFIPRFKYDYQIQLKDDLDKLGVTDVFSERAKLTGIATDESLHVDDAIHKANIEFAESGIKAAAVTTFLMTTGITAQEDQPEPVVVRINRPFMFVIRDKNNGQIWFVGTVYEPEEWAKG